MGDVEKFSLGIDIGGTFTDANLMNEETGEVSRIVYEGQGKKFKVTGACATCI